MSTSSPPPTTREDGAPAPSPRQRAAALTLAAGPLLFLAAEAAAATAWKGPTYSYTGRWISDLGVPTPGTFQGRDIDSPLHAVLNTALITHGALLLVGVTLLAALLPTGTRTRTRGWLVAVAAASATGFAMTGLFHTSTAAAGDGTLALHYAGATTGIIGSGALALITGPVWRAAPASRSLGPASTALGVLALAASVALVVTTTAQVPHGLIERCAVYAGIAWQLLVVAHLLRRPTRRPVQHT